MINEKIDLYGYFGLKRGKDAEGYLTSYVPSNTGEIKQKLRPAVIIIPGGAYRMCSEREGEPVAIKFLNEGYAAFVLNYSVFTAYPVPLAEALAAVAYVRRNAQRFAVDVNHVATLGFSAGGHLAGMTATMFDDKKCGEMLGIGVDELRPNATVLCYPVTTSDKAYAHAESFRIISGGDSALADYLSLEKRVNANSVPSFIWHTAADDCVPVNNSLLLAEAYLKCGVPCALHVFEKGWHGLSLCNCETNDQTEEDAALVSVRKWFDLAIDWLRDRNFAVKVK